MPLEDGSAASVENILVQTGALGFYQKRLFMCTCFLQALTVSALIYASHCRPDLTPTPSSPTATNGDGALDHYPQDQQHQHGAAKCGPSTATTTRSKGQKEDTDLKVFGRGNETANAGFPAVSQNDSIVEGGGGGGGGDGSRDTGGGGEGRRRGKRSAAASAAAAGSAAVTDFSVSFSSDRRLTTTVARAHRGGVAGVQGEDFAQGSIPAKNSASSRRPAQHKTTVVRHDHGKSSRKPSSAAAVTRSSFSSSYFSSSSSSPTDVAADLGKNEDSHSGSYVTSPGVPDHRDYVTSDTGVHDSWWNSDSVGGSTVSLRDRTKDKRESTRLPEATTDGRASGVWSPSLSSSSTLNSVSFGGTGTTTVAESGVYTTIGVVIKNGVNPEKIDGDAVSGEEEADCEEKHEVDEPHYLTLTYLPVPEWMQEANSEQLAQYNAYCQAVGAMVGAALGAMGADQVGRRRPLFVCFPLMLIAHCLSGCAVSWTMLVIFRFLVGVFAGACAVVSLVFPLEFIGTEWRDACLCSGIWVVGVVVISLELLVTRHWRYLAFISGGIGLPLVGTYFIASESARWLLCHQRFPEAEQTLKEIISCNSTSVPDFLSLFDKSRACVVTNMHPKRYTFLDLFHSLEMTKWTVALVYTCLVGSSVYFCLLSKVKVMTGNVYLDNSLPFVMDLPLGWSAVVVNRCLGRRWCLFLYAVASGLALLSVLVLHMTGNLSHMPSMLTGMAVFGKIGVTASLGLVFVIAVEMYPTVVRCMGVAVAVIAVSGGSMLADVFVIFESYHYTVPFIVFGAMMASVGFAGLLFPETLHCPLPNILPCRHRTIPIHEGVRLVTNPWDVL